MSIFLDYFYTLIQSALLELVVYIVVIPLFFKTEIVNHFRKKICFMVLPINAIAHPLFFFFIMGLPIHFLANILIAQLIIITIEAFCLTRIFNLSWPKAFALSTIVNFVSWQFGPLLTYWIKS